MNPSNKENRKRVRKPRGVIKDIRRRTTKSYNAEEKIRIVIEGLTPWLVRLCEPRGKFSTQSILHFATLSYRITLYYSVAYYYNQQAH
jgi:hypothetical protein